MSAKTRANVDCLKRADVPLRAAGGMIGATVYLAVVAFPESEAKQRKFCEDVKAWFVRDAVRRGWPRNRARPQYLKRRKRDLEISGPLVTATRRIERERLPAAGLAIDMMIASIWPKDSRFQLQTMRGEIVVRSIATGSLGIARQFAELGWRPGSEDADADFAKHFQQRAWRSTKPVLHFAIELKRIVDEKGSLSLVDLIRSPGWVQGALLEAEKLRRMLPAIPVLRATLSNTISLRAKA